MIDKKTLCAYLATTEAEKLRSNLLQFFSAADTNTLSANVKLVNDILKDFWTSLDKVSAPVVTSAGMHHIYC